MRVFKNKPFGRFARKNRISEEDLCDAITRLEKGIVDADLGGGVIKQRVARANEGRSGGFRTIILVTVAERAFFVYGFAKNDRANIQPDELIAFRRLLDLLSAYSDAELEIALEVGALTEVGCEDEDIQE